MPFDTAGFSPLTYEQKVDLALLRKVREALGRRNSWCKHQFMTDPSKRCISGWIAFYVGGRSEVEIMQKIAVFLPRSRWNGHTDRDRVIAFNDSKSTRKIDIVRLINKTIAAIENA